MLKSTRRTTRKGSFFGQMKSVTLQDLDINRYGLTASYRLLNGNKRGDHNTHSWDTDPVA